MNAELMRLRLKLMTMLVLTTLGCVTAGSLSTTTGGPRRPVQSVVGSPPGWVFWREPGIGAHWPVARAQVANRGQVLIRVGRRALLRDLATGRDVATFTLPPVSSSGRSLPPLEEGPTAVSADGSLVALSEGNTVAAHSELSGRHVAPVYGVAASGRRGSLQIMSFIDFTGDRICAHRAVIDFVSSLDLGVA